MNTARTRTPSVPGVRRVWPVLGVLAFLLAAPAPAADPEPEVAHLEKALREAGLATDGPGLLAYLKERTLSDGEHQRLEGLVRQLGDDSFAQREKATVTLTRAGRPALTFLKPAVRHADLEVRWRARQCVRKIETAPEVSHLGSVIRLLALKKPEGTAEALLAYLPGADDPILEEIVFAALAEAAVREGNVDPAVREALAGKHPLRRAAAARAVSRAPGAEQRAPVAGLLDDPDVRVRFEAAVGLATAGDRQAVPVLLRLLADAPPSLAWQAEDLLFRIAREESPAVSLGAADAEARARCRSEWERWWAEQGEKVGLAHLKDFRPVRGLTVVCDYDEGRVWEFDRDGKVRWEITDLSGPNDAQVLPGGRVLIAERNGRRVTERDRGGKVLWEHKARNNPIACQRLGNGNTLVTTWSEAYEVSPTQEVVRTHANRAGFRHAVLLGNGHLIYVTSRGEVVQLDEHWKPLRTTTPVAHAHGAGYWASIDPLPGGRFLIALGGAGRVLEIDAEGKVTWEHAEHSPVFATRLRNGNTLISSFDGRYLVEVDRAGKEVDKHPLRGRPFAARRY